MKWKTIGDLTDAIYFKIYMYSEKLKSPSQTGLELTSLYREAQKERVHNWQLRKTLSTRVWLKMLEFLVDYSVNYEQVLLDHHEIGLYWPVRALPRCKLPVSQWIYSCLIHFSHILFLLIVYDDFVYMQLGTFKREIFFILFSVRHQMWTPSNLPNIESIQTMAFIQISRPILVTSAECMLSMLGRFEGVHIWCLTLWIGANESWWNSW